MESEFEIFLPSDILKPYVKCYWVCVCDEDVVMDIMYPSGFVELCIDISKGKTVRHFGDRTIKMPDLEVLGHFTGPTRATIAKGTTVLVTRFYPYASSLFFPDQVSQFTNESINLSDILNKESREFYNQLMDQHSLEEKIKILDGFLIQLLSKNNRKQEPFKLLEHLCSRISQNDETFNLKELSASYGFSQRYIQKLFLDWVGITPKSFHSIQRFNKSLELIQSSGSSLTSIAHECGYYDQAHFIKEFKSFAGITPSQAMRLSG